MRARSCPRSVKCAWPSPCRCNRAACRQSRSPACGDIGLCTALQAGQAEQPRRSERKPCRGRIIRRPLNRQAHGVLAGVGRDHPLVGVIPVGLQCRLCCGRQAELDLDAARQPVRAVHLLVAGSRPVADVPHCCQSSLSKFFSWEAHRHQGTAHMPWQGFAAFARRWPTCVVLLDTHLSSGGRPHSCWCAPHWSIASRWRCVSSPTCGSFHWQRKHCLVNAVELVLQVCPLLLNRGKVLAHAVYLSSTSCSHSGSTWPSVVSFLYRKRRRCRHRCLEAGRRHSPVQALLLARVVPCISPPFCKWGSSPI